MGPAPLPIVGAAVVWVPAIAYLFISASIGERGYFGPIFLTIWGVIIVPIIEHVVRPWAMRGKVQLPAIPLLISVLGGMEAFGFISALRLDHQVEQLRRGEAPDNFIDPKTLNPLARSYLRDAFRAVASVQSGLANELAMGIRWS